MYFKLTATLLNIFQLFKTTQMLIKIKINKKGFKNPRKVFNTNKYQL